MHLLLKFPLILFSYLYGAGNWIHRKLTFSRKCPVNVISVGNITTGGTGKTPLAINILSRFSRGKAALVSRGYGRRSSGVSVVTDGDDYSAAGDETVMARYMIPGIKAVVGENRYKAACRAAGLGVEAVVLDDGFQSWELERDIDVVTIDALNPFGGRRLLPAGTLREPLSSLKRADAVVIGRSELAGRERVREIEEEIVTRSRAEIFHSVEKASGLLNLSTGEKSPVSYLRGKKVYCFSGIANPAGFHKLAEKWGASVEGTTCMGDHHEWTSEELEGIKNKAYSMDALPLTTAKDAVKIMGSSSGGVWVLELETEIKEEQKWKEFLEDYIA